MIEALDELDKHIFLFFNGLHSPAWDAIMAFFTAKVSWFPLYGAILFAWFYKFRWHGFLFVVGIALTITCADLFASGFCKPFFGRLRPCHSPELQGLVHVVNGCGGQFGFISSHAANTFALAAFLNFTLGKNHPWLKWFYLWAALVAYSRIAVGVHYPGDILVGGLTGVFWGWLFAQLTKKAFSQLDRPLTEPEGKG